MLVLNKTVFAMMVGFIIAAILGLFLVPYLKKMKADQRISEFVKQHKKKKGTPTMGGLIFIFGSIIGIFLLIFYGMIELSENLIIVIFVFFAYALIGFIDDYLKIKRKNNAGLSRMQKLIMQLVIAIVFFYIFMSGGGEPILWIYTLGIKINMGWVYGLFILFMLIGTSNAVNITDGLDGLAGGLAAMAFGAFGLISWGAGWLEGNQDIALFCFIIVGALLGFLIYNAHPAKIFMGDTGSLALGGTLASIAILTSHEVTLAIVGGVFVIEALSSVIQIISIRTRGKRVFPMAPLHHSFEKMGWEEKDIVKMFWIAGFILAMASIAFGVWI
ncbi:MAG: phospho-N-acetylmuramoyl-pentapeptide-transferase [Bacilli bacterium]